MSNIKRILHVIGGMDRGGAETLIMNIYRNIDRTKVQFDFAVHTNNRCHYDDEIESLGGKIYHLPRFKIYNIIDYKISWNKLLSKGEWQIIHGHLDSTASIYLKIAKKYGLITIAHSHSTSSGTGVKKIIVDYLHRDIVKFSDYNFACSTESGEWLFGKNSNFSIIYNGIEMKKFIFDESIRKNVRNELNLNNKFVIGHVANYTYPKNHKFIIELFKIIAEKDSNANLVLAGKGVKENIYESIRGTLIENKITFLGVRNDINRVLQAFDVFILPSLYEGLPVSLVEAQASGLQCIASDQITKEVKYTENLEFIPINNNDSLKKWANKILSLKNIKHKNLYDELVDSEFNIIKVSKSLQNFYLNL
ncbi:glycosyltransferase family 1 protein [Anaerococcus sp. NML200537]|uniref:glycosyltransferase family 1 protein n=1 Tax=Anaerococcus sp. NML200537 TaxID=2954485 RepID=UPI002237E864|nr:glycosyltransferase family 1 protein [Anaerococcus sp. NML200537]MCW6700871.1 glycosyltransferase family 1 protein [Anaerococcus sp. NML200537]